MDPKISRQSLSGTINQKVYVWNLFLPKDRSLAIKNEGEIKPYFRDTYSGTPCIFNRGKDKDAAFLIKILKKCWFFRASVVVEYTRSPNLSTKTSTLNVSQI